MLWHYYEKDKDNDDQRRPMSKISKNLADAPSANKSLPIYTKLALIHSSSAIAVESTPLTNLRSQFADRTTASPFTDLQDGSDANLIGHCGTSTRCSFLYVLLCRHVPVTVLSYFQRYPVCWQTDQLISKILSFPPSYLLYTSQCCCSTQL